MANRVSVQPTEFVNHYPDGSTESTYGFRIFDDHEVTYNNFFTDMEQVMEACHPDRIVETLMDTGNEAIADILEFVYDGQLGITIAGRYVPFEEIDWTAKKTGNPTT